MNVSLHLNYEMTLLWIFKVIQVAISETNFVLLWFPKKIQLGKNVYTSEF